MDAIYCRQSLDIKDSLSIETQIETCSRLTGEYKTYIDKGFSGKNTNRPAFLQMMEDIRAGKIRNVIVYRLDRLSRSLLDFATLWNELQKYQVDFQSANENFDTSTPIGKAMIFIIMIFAQLERETISERVTDNYYKRVEEGRWPGGPAPYGFDNGKTIDAEGRKVPTLVPNVNLEVMRRIFERYGYTNISLGQLARDLVEEGIPCMQRSTWNNVSLSKLLRNPVYVKMDFDVLSYYRALGLTIINDIDSFTGINGGMIVGKRGTLAGAPRQHKKYEDMTLAIGNWKGYIAPQLFLTVQDKLNTNRKIGNANSEYFTWLTGILKCGSCGYGMHGSHAPGVKIRYIHCSGRYQGNNRCSMITDLRLDDIESTVEEQLIQAIEESSGDNLRIHEDQELNERKIALDKLEKQIEKRIRRLVDDDVSATIKEYLNKEVEELNQQKKELLLKPIRKPRPITIKKIDFRSLEKAKKRIVAKNYIDKVFIFKDSIEIIWKV